MPFPVICFYLLQLADPGQGVIDLSWRAVPCSAASARNGTASEEDQKKLENDLGEIKYFNLCTES